MKKEKWGSDPNNVTWSENHSRFGFAMLQKMGWKENEGLGPEGRKGISTHIKVIRRTDNRGIGANVSSIASVNEWAQGSQALSGVLERLSKSCTPPPPSTSPSLKETTPTPLSEPEDNENKKRKVPSGVRPGRMLNMRNVRAKTAKRTQDDLSCILVNSNCSQQQQQQQMEEKEEEKQETAENEQEQPSAEPIVVSTVSSAEYFKNKLQQHKKHKK